jgi:ethanolamine utilization protein EutP (predicted NTPase)
VAVVKVAVAAETEMAAKVVVIMVAAMAAVVEKVEMAEAEMVSAVTMVVVWARLKPLQSLVQLQLSWPI